MKTISCFKPAAGNGFLPHNMLMALALWACLPIGSLLQAASPDLQYAEPRGGQRGTEVEVKIVGSRLWDAEEILFHQPGITWKEIKHDEKKSGRFFNVKFVVAPNATLGEHAFRVRTKSGITYARRFWVSQFPNALEKEPNNEFETPQDVALNVTVDGYSKPETADFYRVNAKKGQRLSVEVEGLRANSIRNRVAIDPYCAILNSERFELVSSDDTPLLKQDCYVSMLVPEDGQYIVEVRDASYQGNGRYRAHIGTFPRPRAIFPAGGKAGSSVDVTLIGDVKGDFKTKVQVPNELNDKFGVFAEHEGQLPPSANVFRVVSYDNVMENEAINDNWATVKESSGALPLAFNGILQAKTDAEGNPVQDYDYFRFTAKKGQRFRFRAHAKKINSPVDPVLHVFRPNGTSVATVGGNDDADGSADSRYDFAVPADGDYWVRVYDMLKRGGDDYVYRIETEITKPALVVSMPEFATRDNQFRKAMEVPQGGRFATVFNVTRQSVRCDATFEVKGLPPGITFSADQLPANVTQFPVVFEAQPNAPVAGRLAEFYALSTDKEKPLTGRYTQLMDYVRGNPNGTLYYARTEDTLPVAVTEAAPFKIDLVKPDKPILRDGNTQVKVRATRSEGFTKPITVRWLWRPPGISCNSTVTIPEGKTEAVFTLNCNGAAETRTWKVVALGESDAGKGIVRSASALTDLTVADHFVKLKINMASVKQGQSGDMVIDVEPVRDFSGEATVKLLGLPPKTSITEGKLKKGQDKLVLKVTTEEGARVGQHKNLFCQLIFNEGGKVMEQRAGQGGVLRVDPKPKEPAKPAPKAPATAQAKAPAPKPAEKPLSRLEQLRLEAKKQAEANKK